MNAHWSAAVLMMAVAAQAESTRYPISARQVASVLSRDASQVAMLAKVDARDPAPQLDVLQVTPARGVGGSGTKTLVKLRCHEALNCLPFYALVEGEVVVPEMSARVIAKPTKAAPRPVIVMRAGVHAMLELDSPRAHMQVAVVSLENGSMGKRIRVATLDHKEFFEAEVAGPTLLKGRF